MKQLIKFGLILASICLVATLALSAVYIITKPKIDQRLKTEEEDALKAVIPEADSFTPNSIGGIDYFEAYSKGRLAGYCVKIVGAGYGGFIRIITGITPEGVIKGVKVLEHYETPGLGARINEIKRGEGEPWFLRQFKGRSVNNIAVKKDINAVTGATISSKAVCDAINKTVNEFLGKLKE